MRGVKWIVINSSKVNCYQLKIRCTRDRAMNIRCSKLRCDVAMLRRVIVRIMSFDNFTVLSLGHHLMMSKGLKSVCHKVGLHRPTTLRVIFALRDRAILFCKPQTFKHLVITPLWRSQYIFQRYFNIIKMPGNRESHEVSENFDLLYEYFTPSD